MRFKLVRSKAQNVGVALLVAPFVTGFVGADYLNVNEGEIIFPARL